MMNENCTGGTGVYQLVGKTVSHIIPIVSSIQNDTGLMRASTSVNGFTYPRGQSPQQQELCLICGDKSTGYHYKALSCEGCKAFFRRSVWKGEVYECKNSNNCVININTRRDCQECRFMKCLSVGINSDCVVPYDQCVIKRKLKISKDQVKSKSTAKNAMKGKKIEDNRSVFTSYTVNINSNDIRPLTNLQQNMIKYLVEIQKLFERPSKEDVDKITPFPSDESETDIEMKKFHHVTQMTVLTVTLIVKFSKNVPDFKILSIDDQEVLMRACSSEVMMLMASRMYDFKTDSIVYASNQYHTRDHHRSSSIGDLTDDLYDFCRSLSILGVDDEEYALHTVIVIFSERPSLSEPKIMENIQEFYVTTLQAYVDDRRPPVKCYFALLLGTLTSIRTLGHIWSEMCFSLNTKNKKLEPLLAQIWGMK